MHVPLDVGVFLGIINLCIFVFTLLFRRLHNLDVEVAASGFTRDMSESFDEVKTCEDTFIANREGREEKPTLTDNLSVLKKCRNNFECLVC